MRICIYGIAAAADSLAGGHIVLVSRNFIPNCWMEIWLEIAITKEKGLTNIG
jgi:hypothetical protein